LHSGGDVDRNRGLLAIDAKPVLGDALDPRGVDLPRVECGVAISALLTEVSGDFFGDDVVGVLAQKLDVGIERAARVVGRKPRRYLLVGQPLELSSLASHSSALRIR